VLSQIKNLHTPRYNPSQAFEPDVKTVPSHSDSLTKRTTIQAASYAPLVMRPPTALKARFGGSQSTLSPREPMKSAKEERTEAWVKAQLASPPSRPLPSPPVPDAFHAALVTVHENRLPIHTSATPPDASIQKGPKGKARANIPAGPRDAPEKGESSIGGAKHLELKQSAEGRG
jgi:hypothetical protein